MKKAICVLMYLLLAVTVTYPAGVLTSACFGYDFKLGSVSAFAIIISILSLCIAILDLKCKSTGENKIMQILLPIVTPCSIINAMLCIFACPQIWVIISVLISVGCCVFLTLKYGNDLSLILSSIMIIPIGLFSIIGSAFGGFVQNTVIKTIDSPRGEYYAQVIESDQGALGGDTFIDVYKNGINAFVFKTEKKIKRAYDGDFGEYKNMQIYWKNDNCLVINSIEYVIE